VPGGVSELVAVGVAFVSALLPVVNIEAYVAAIAAGGVGGNLWLLCALVAFGQMAGKLVWFYAGAHALNVRWVRRKMSSPKRTAQLQRWQVRVGGRPGIASATVFAAGSVGLPPLAVVSVLAGQLRVPLALFLIAGTTGRFLRFALLAHGATLLPVG
jgi:membrane protein YqaA with SNARE-associated domain